MTKQGGPFASSETVACTCRVKANAHAAREQGTMSMTDPNRREAPYRVAGCDLGKSAAKFVVGRSDANGKLEIEQTEIVEHDGRPMEAFRDWYERENVASCAALGATGLHADERVAPVIAGLPEGAWPRA